MKSPLILWLAVSLGFIAAGSYVVHRSVRRHNGRVWAESKPGEGAVFRFSIPAGESGHA